MGNLYVVDLVMMAVYFLILLWIGFSVFKSKKGISEIESFLAADRKMNLFCTTCSTAATDLGGGFSIAMGGLGFTLGISGSWIIAISGLSVIIASFFMVPKVKKWADKVKGFTIGDIFEQRFDRKTGIIAAILIGLSWFAFVGGQIIAGGKLIQVTMKVDLTIAIFIAGSIILAYTAMGGLKAVIYTDVFQMIILMVGIVIIMFPVGLIKVGGWSSMIEHFSADPDTYKMINWGAAGWKTILGWFLSIFPIWFISITGIQRIIAAKDEKTARRAFFLTGIPIEWPLFAIGSTFVGMFARLLVPELRDPELATPTMIITLLPVGVTGIVIAAYIAAVMSTADSSLIGAVTIFTNDIYKKIIKPNATEIQMVKVARIATIAMGVSGIFIAYMVPNVLNLILYAYTFSASGMFIPMLGLLFWKRATTAGAFWSIIIGGCSSAIWTLAGNPGGFLASYVGWGGAFLSLVIISLCTRHSPEEDIYTFFGGSKK